ncbi:unnamed protein product [Jaminaea pallidilutea]
MTDQQDQSKMPSVPGNASVDPEVPKTAKEAPIVGIEAGKDVPFKEQVQGHAKYFAGKIFGKDNEVQQGAARARGEEDTLPAELQKGAGSGSSS